MRCSYAFGFALAVLAGSSAAHAQDATRRWSGLYFGLHAGVASSDVSSSAVTPSSNSTFILSIFDDAGPFFATPEASLDDDHGFIGGLQLGYNFRTGGLVLGLEGDISGTALDSSDSTTKFPGGGTRSWTTTLESEVDWLATLRGRVGFVPADWLMIYGTGGVAFAEVETSLTYQNDHPIGLTAIDIVSTLACPGLSVCFSGSEKETLTGWTAGGGFELALGGKASLKGEYLFVDLGSHSVRAGGVSPLTTPDNAISTRVDTELHVGRVGINFQLD